MYLGRHWAAGYYIYLARHVSSYHMKKFTRTLVPGTTEDRDRPPME